MIIVRICKLGTRTKFGHRLPITNEGSINRTFKNRDRSITGSSVKILLAILELITQYIRDELKARAKAETIFAVRNQAEITFANFVTYWKLRGYNFRVLLKGLSKNSYNKPRYLSRRM